MTNEQKAAVDRAAENYSFRVPYDGSNDFYDEAAAKHAEWGMQHVIDNAGEFGLVTKRSYDDVYAAYDNLEKHIAQLHIQLKKYRKALERIITPVHGEYPNIENVNWIAKEALKQQ